MEHASDLNKSQFIFSCIFSWYAYQENVPWHLKAGHDEIHIQLFQGASLFVTGIY